eukprot:CAMPEP_0184870306 /NCGR_PEP_ID=MMETSP0580-20130426/37050_1 /TAXON_ID=1118495 /ORGANISM="Dactyliosolen fragilissimus" /LENGTH=370 /DNA_ID=CAMNT_0027372321 /DNA_START=70 /DNA_END=1179 /DNA_ORIENTATION=+
MKKTPELSSFVATEMEPSRTKNGNDKLNMKVNNIANSSLSPPQSPSRSDRPPNRVSNIEDLPTKKKKSLLPRRLKRLFKSSKMSKSSTSSVTQNGWVSCSSLGTIDFSTNEDFDSDDEHDGADDQMKYRQNKYTSKKITKNSLSDLKSASPKTSQTGAPYSVGFLFDLDFNPVNKGIGSQLDVTSVNSLLRSVQINNSCGNFDESRLILNETLKNTKERLEMSQSDNEHPSSYVEMTLARIEHEMARTDKASLKCEDPKRQNSEEWNKCIAQLEASKFKLYFKAVHHLESELNKLPSLDNEEYILNDGRDVVDNALYLLHTLGRLYDERLGEYKKALACYEEALETEMIFLAHYKSHDDANSKSNQRNYW